MLKKYLIGMVCMVVFGLTSFQMVRAEMTSEELARLGKDLTPMGAEQAGNQYGTIPAWEGGLKVPPQGLSGTGKYPDPFSGDKVLFTITKKNMEEYADRLTPGQKAMLNAYDTFSMNVYETRRTACAPEHIYDQTRKLAATAKLTPDGNGVTGGVGGVPFPIPQNGLEAVWNHTLRYRPDLTRYYVQAALNRSGKYTPARYYEHLQLLYYQEGMTEEKMENIFINGFQQILSPPRIAGRLLLLKDTLNQAKEHRKAWVYNPGQRRVRRAPPYCL